jgi:hypothetical protein
MCTVLTESKKQNKLKKQTNLVLVLVDIFKSLTKRAGSGSVNQVYLLIQGSGPVPKCHGSGTLLPIFSFSNAVKLKNALFSSSFYAA